jgi:O-antigen/teichoic acid export membrane protein
VTNDSLTHRALRSSASSWLEQGWRIIDGVLITPVIMQVLGPSCWGLWAAVKQAQAYMALADFRSSGTMKTLLSANQHQSQPKEFRELLGAATRVSGVGIVLMMVSGLIFCLFSSTLVPVQVTETSLRTVILFAVSTVAVANLGALAGSALRGCNHDYKSLGLRLGISAFCSMISLLAVLGGWGIVGLAAAALCGAILTAAMWFRLAQVSLPWFGIERPTSSYLRRFVRQCGHNTMGALGQSMLLNSDVIVISVILGAQVAGVYAATVTIARLAMSAADTVTASTSTGISGLVGSAKSGTACAAIKATGALTTSYIISAGSALLIINQSMVPRWLGEAFHIGQLETVGVIALLISQQRFRFVAMVAQTTLEFRKQARILLVTGALGIGIAIITCKLVGIVGVAFGFAAAAMLASTLTMRLIRQTLGDSIAAATAVPRKTAFIGAAILLVACGLAPEQLDWVSIIGSGVAGFTLSGVIIVSLGTDREERQFVFSRVPVLNRIVRRSSKPRDMS